ncbi:Asparaginase [Gracilaria domingensis]|nr:Asparaginase [Gracilaria domingensis]
MASVVSTWEFSKEGVLSASDALSSSFSSAIAVETGIKAVEEDESVTSAGYGGLPNAAGILQLDAAMMNSAGNVGSVMALTGYRSAIDIAHAVLRHSNHPMLAGEGAALFAKQHGFLARQDLLTPHAAMRYQQFLASSSSSPEYHTNGGMAHSDTVGMIARDRTGAITVGCATSGMQFKSVGRVGDSPIVGAGLYASQGGAAVASGDGDKMMRFCLAFLTVERMSDGCSATEASRYAIRRIREADDSCQAAIVAMTSDGAYGAACTHDGFSAIGWREGMSQIESIKVKGEISVSWKHSCV